MAKKSAAGKASAKSTKEAPAQKQPENFDWMSSGLRVRYLVIPFLIFLSFLFYVDLAQENKDLRDDVEAWETWYEDNIEAKVNSDAGAKDNSGEAVTSSSDSLIDQLRKVADLPVDEADPTIATVTDAETLRNLSDFYAEAEEGDKIISYQTQIYLFRPTTGELINEDSTQMNLDEDGTEAETAEEATTRVCTVRVQNGTDVSGAAGTWTTRINTNVTGVEIETLAATNAQQKDQSQSIVVDLTKDGGCGVTAKAVNEVVGGEVVDSLPSGLSETTAEVVVILGADKAGQ